MATSRIAINGFGRIGRNAFKIAFDRDDIEIVAINDLTDIASLAHLLKHDSTYGEYESTVTFDDESISVDGHKVKVLSVADPKNLPWKELGIDVVIESTGFFTEADKAQAHIKAGAKKVIISAPAKGDVTTIVLGVNDEEIGRAGSIISCASCTTNCITPVMAVLENNFGIEKAMMNTIHSYTSDQRLLDSPHKDPRRARAAGINIIPTSTGASNAAADALPSLKGVFGGTSYRVPTPTVSICDIVALLKTDTTIEELKKVFVSASEESYYQGILAATDEELVSSDFIGNAYSSIVDLPMTQVVDGNLVKIVAWYDNEWGYSNRLVELTAEVANGLEMNNDEIRRTADLLRKLKPGFLPYEIFVEIMRLTMASSVEIVVLRRNSDKLQVLLTKRPPDDEFWPNKWHIPGSIFQADDTSIEARLQATIDRELPNTKFVSEKEWVPELFIGETARNRNIPIIFRAWANESGDGEFFDVENLPDDFLSEQKILIEIATKDI